MKISEVLGGNTPPFIDQLANEFKKLKLSKTRLSYNPNANFTKNGIKRLTLPIFILTP